MTDHILKAGETLSKIRKAIFAVATAVLGALMLTPTTWAQAAREPATRPVNKKYETVTPREQTDAVLHNPDMGWIFYENYPLDQRPGGSSSLLELPHEEFPVADEVAIMFSWSDIEGSEGKYDFSKADYAYDYWRKRGKQIQLRLSSETLLWWSGLNPPAGKGIPDYVLRRIPDGKKQVRDSGGNAYTVVDAREPYYRERLAKFLAAVESHFDKNRPVTLIDLRGFGLWGEWHTGFRYASLEDRHAALSGIIDIWSAAFADHYLALSFSYDPDSPKVLWDGPYRKYDPAFAKTYDQFLRYSAFDHALTKPNVTARRDGAGGAVHSNERRLNQEAFAAFKGPMVSEFLGGYADLVKGGRKWVNWVVKDALSLHPNYICLLGWSGPDAMNFVRERPDLVAVGAINMGYRLVPTRVAYPREFASGKELRLQMTWVNRAVGRAMRDYMLKIALIRDIGEIVESCDAGAMPTSRWIRENMYPVVATGILKSVPAGDYALCIGLSDPVSGKAIQLPLAGGRVGGWYEIGPITCVKTAKN